MDGLGASTTLAIRFGVAAAVLFALLATTGRSLLPARGERVAAFLVGAIGYAFESTLFFMGLERGTAAAVALLFYAYPALVMLGEVALGRARPTPLALGALALAVAGTVVVVVGGAEVSITTAGVAFALGSAVSFAIYVIVSHQLLPRSDAAVTAAWVAAGASAGQLAMGVATGSLVAPGDRLGLLVLNGAATAVAFGLMFAALRRIGPGPTAVVMTLEAVFSVLLAALFLDERLTAMQAVGGVAVLAGAVLVSLQRPRDATPVVLPEP